MKIDQKHNQEHGMQYESNHVNIANFSKNGIY